MRFANSLLSAPLSLFLLMILTGPRESQAASVSTLHHRSSSTATPVSSQLANQNLLDQTALKQAVLAEINQVRTQPAAYADKLESFRPYYRDHLLSLPDEAQLLTVEGTAALDEAIAFLRAATPLPPLQLSPGLSQAAADQVKHLQAQVSDGLDGGGSLQDRINRYGAPSGHISEWTSQGKTTATAIVALLMLGDGDPNRSLRAELLSDRYQVIGLDCEPAASAGVLCVMDAATAYVEQDGTRVGNAGQSRRPEPMPMPTVAEQWEDGRPASASFTPVTEPPNSAVSPVAAQKKATSSVAPPLPSASNPLPPEPLNAATPTPEPTSLEAGVLAETNRVRANPAAYAAELEKLRPYYDGIWLRLPGTPAIETEEGVAALDEAIAVLRQSAAMPLLKFSQGLSLAARDHVADLGSKGKVGHYGSDGSDAFVRMNRYGIWQGIAGENISYSPLHAAQWHVVQWLVDDGVADRGHRKALLQPEYRVTGVACGTHKIYGSLCVMNYAGQYTEKRP